MQLLESVGPKQDKPTVSSHSFGMSKQPSPYNRFVSLEKKHDLDFI